MSTHDYTFSPLEGSEGRRGKVVGSGDCPEEGDWLKLPYDDQELDYQVTFSQPRGDGFVALVVRDSEQLA